MPPPVTFPCPTLGGDVELPEAREAHIIDGKPYLAQNLHGWLAETLLQPDFVAPEPGDPTRTSLYRVFPDLLGGKLLHVIVKRDSKGGRLWIITAFPLHMKRGPSLFRDL